MDFTNDFSVSSDTKEYMISGILPKSKELFILLNMIHFIERIIWFASIFAETKENPIIRIYYSHDKLFIFDYSEWGILNISFLILDNCLIKISQDVCKSLCILNLCKELLQLIHGVNDIGSVLITHDG